MLQQLPEFPTYTLPPWLAEFVSALSEALQTPIDLAGMLALDVLAVAAGGRVQLQIKPDWSEPLNLYTIVAALPGERKSAAVKAMAKPLVEFAKQIVSEKSHELSKARARRRVCEKALEAAQNAAAKAEGNQREQSLEKVDLAAIELQDAIFPAEFRLFADDATPESLATLMAEQRGRIAVLSAEGGIFGQMAGRYGASNGQPNLDVYLKGHSGDLLQVDRKGRASECVEQPALTIGLAVQPDVIQSIVDQPGFEGRGLLARFLYSLPQSRVGGRRSQAPPVSEQIAREYEAAVRLLARNLEQLPQLHTLTLSKGARMVLDDFSDELEPKLGEQGELSHIAYWGCKLAGAIARISAQLHLGRNVRGQWGGQVELIDMEGALA
ncbi:MAG: YfjI family protein, partial [Candidatus Dormibacteraceae bacterium]